MSRETLEICLIVDAYSTGRYIAPMLLGYGYKCIHIQSSDSLPEKLTKSLRKDDFLKNIIHTGDINDILSQIKGCNVKLCVAGYEPGVELADMLCKHLNLLGNNVELSQARRNKWDMIDRVSSEGLLTAKHFRSNSLEKIYGWMELNQINFPVVLKPTLSANGDNVHFCASRESIQTAFVKILESQTCFAQKNEEVLIETYLEGEEYIVNTVSHASICYTVEIWRIKRKPLSTIYDRGEVVNISEKEYQELSEFTSKVLKALGIFYGAATTELKYTKNGVALIETGARLMGGMELSFSTTMFGYNQLTLMLESYFNPSQFKKIAAEENSDTQNKYGFAVLLISDVAGYIKQEFRVDSFKELLSFYSMDFPTKGDKLVVTTDSLTGPGVIHLVAESKEQLLKDYEKIRSIEKTLYKDLVSEHIYSSTSMAKKFFDSYPVSNQSIVQDVNSVKQAYIPQGCII